MQDRQELTMHAIDLDFASRHAVREALLDTFAEGGVFAPGDYGITSGSAVMVRVSAEGLHAGVFLEGIVQWRRVGRSRAAETAAGLGVRVLANQRERFTFLRRWADGAHDGSGRGASRYPFELKAFLSTTGRATGRLLHATLRDVSEQGALLATPTRVTVGTTMALEFMHGANAHMLTGRIAWADDARAGIHFDLAKPDDQSAWARVLDDAIGAFGRRLVTPKHSSEPPPAR